MIGILTFYWADDCGAMLQSYALKTYLGRYEPTIFIPYFPKPLRSRYWLLRYDERDNVLRRGIKMAKQLRPRNFYRSCVVKYRMCRFRKKYLTQERKRLGSPKEIFEFAANIDTYVVGSDQVWNPEITSGFQEGYFCTFRKWEKKGKRYVSYAASMGAERLNRQYAESLRHLLTHFDVISLRESLAVPYIQSLCGKELSVVLDPVFLLKREEWMTLFEGRSRRKKKYIAVYDTEYNVTMAKYLVQLERETGFEILNLRKGKYCWTEDTRDVVGCGPAEFLELLFHAEYVVTNSFHGTAFSILFHKPFTVFLHSERGARVRDLLRVAHLEERMAEKEKSVKGMEEMETKINWDETDRALQEEIGRSRDFIQREILAPVT